MASPRRLLALALLGAASCADARWQGGAFVPAASAAGGARLPHQEQQQKESRRPRALSSCPPALAATGGGRGRLFPLDPSSPEWYDDEDEEEGGLAPLPFDDDGATAVLAADSSRRPRALSALLSLEASEPPPQAKRKQHQQQRQRRPGQQAAAATTSGSTSSGQQQHHRHRRAPLHESLRRDASRPLARSWRRGQQQQQQPQQPPKPQTPADAVAAAAAAAVVSTFLGGGSGHATTTTPYHRNYQPPPAPMPAVPASAAPSPSPAAAISSAPLHLAHPRFRTEDDGADVDGAAGGCGHQGLAKAAGLLARCEWRFSAVTSVERVSPDGSVRRVRLEPLPGLPGLIPHHVSARQPGQYLGLRVPVYDPAVSLTKPARVFRVLAPVASAPERVGPREYVDVLLDGREELVLPFGSDGAGAHDEDMDSEGVDSTAAAAASALERVLREADLGFGGSSGSSKSDSGAGGGSGNNGGPEAERRAWSRLLSEGGLRVGAVLDVSEEVGPGFVSFLAGPRLALPALLQEHRDLLILARGTAGMAAVASALDWPKVGAHAKAGGGGASTAAAEAGKPLHPHPHHHAHAPAHAPHPHRGRPRITVLLEQDSLAAHDPLRGARARWQAALGSSVRVIPVLRPLRRPQHGGKGHGKGAAASSSTGGASGGGGVEAALFKGEAGGFSPVLGIDPRECAVLVAGMGQRRRARLATSLLRAGVHPARILDHSLDLARGPGVAPPVERCEQLPPGLAAPCCASCGSGSGSGSSSSSWR